MKTGFLLMVIEGLYSHIYDSERIRREVTKESRLQWLAEIQDESLISAEFVKYFQTAVKDSKSIQHLDRAISLFYKEMEDYIIRSDYNKGIIKFSNKK